jgi:hypothetical protein
VAAFRPMALRHAVLSCALLCYAWMCCALLAQGRLSTAAIKAREPKPLKAGSQPEICMHTAAAPTQMVLQFSL